MMTHLYSCERRLLRSFNRFDSPLDIVHCVPCFERHRTNTVL